MQEKTKILIFEFLRYIVVGGIAFLADFGTLYISKEFLFSNMNGNLYYATAIGFMAGLVVNYILSLKFVFTQKKDLTKGRDLKSFAIFSIIGLIGLGLTELGMHIGCVTIKPQLDKFLVTMGGILGLDLVKYGYLLVKCVVTAIVLLWNYAGRKIIIFR